jgi:hypothetical protein
MPSAASPTVAATRISRRRALGGSGNSILRRACSRAPPAGFCGPRRGRPHASPIEVRILGLAALAEDPELEVEVGVQVAKGIGAPEAIPLAAHHAVNNLVSHTASNGNQIKLFLAARSNSDPKS